MSSEIVIRIVTVSALAVLVCRWWQMESLTRGLTLRGGWRWSGAALVVLVFAAASDTGWPRLTPVWQSSVRLLGAVMLLAPAVSVLGARRPGVAAWPWFVVLPLVVVLMWPAVTQIVNLRNADVIQPGLPAFSAMLLVLLMSYGNYFGTAMTVSALLMGLSVVLMLLPLTSWNSGDAWLPAGAVPLCALAATLSVRRLQVLTAWKVTSPQEAADRVWLLFRDGYGLVWATRVASRVNQFALREKWEIRLTMDGFRIRPEGTGTAFGSVVPSVSGRTVLTRSQNSDPESWMSESQLQRPIEVLCWVLQRFAGKEWLETQLAGWFGGREDENADSAV